MSNLPNFKEGLIFDIKDGLNEDNPIIITADVPCLFKITDAINYKNHYWQIAFCRDRDITTNGDEPSEIMPKTYSDLSFLSNKNFISVINWNDSIYALVNPPLCSGDISSFTNGEANYIVIGRFEEDDIGLENPLEEFVLYTQCNFTSNIVSYNNENIYFGKKSYEIILNNPVTTLDWLCNTDETGDELKYYQFLLYNTNEQDMINKCVVDTGKIYTNTTEGNGFVCNSLDDRSTYILVGYCVLQSGQKLDLPDLTVKTAYTTGKIYANLNIELNKSLAENIVCAEMVNLVGNTTNGEPIYIADEKIDLKSNDNTVVFIDDYGVLNDNFLIRLWINGIVDKNKVTILKLNNPKSSDYIEIYYEDGYFYAIKYSCGLISRYISNTIENNNVVNGNIYLSILHCNGRIDIYTKTYEESEAIAL